MCKTCIESFIEFTIPRAIQNPVMQKVCPNGLHPLVHLARDVLCVLLICLVHLILHVPVNNFTVMFGGATASWVLPALLGSKLVLLKDIT